MKPKIMDARAQADIIEKAHTQTLQLHYIHTNNKSRLGLTFEPNNHYI